MHYPPPTAHSFQAHTLCFILYTCQSLFRYLNKFQHKLFCTFSPASNNFFAISTVSYIPLHLYTRQKTWQILGQAIAVFRPFTTAHLFSCWHFPSWFHWLPQHRLLTTPYLHHDNYDDKDDNDDSDDNDDATTATTRAPVNAQLGLMHGEAAAAYNHLLPTAEHIILGSDLPLACHIQKIQEEVDIMRSRA